VDPKFAIVSEKCQKMPAWVSADGRHFEHMVWTGWSRLIWHNSVKLTDNWIKICSPALIETQIKCVKFGLKIPKCLGKNARKPQGGILFDSRCTQPRIPQFRGSDPLSLWVSRDQCHTCWQISSEMSFYTGIRCTGTDIQIHSRTERKYKKN